MKSIKSLIQETKVKGLDKEHEALKIIDDNFMEIFNKIRNLEERNLQYYCSVHHSATVAYAAGTSILPFNSTNYPQYGNMHDNTNNNDKIFIRRSGVYVVAGELQLGATGGGTFRTIAVRYNRGGVPIVAVSTRVLAPAGAVMIAINCATAVYLYAGDTVELIFAHDAGVNIDVTANFPRPSLVVMERREDLVPSEYGLLNPDENMR